MACFQSMSSGGVRRGASVVMLLTSLLALSGCGHHRAAPTAGAPAPQSEGCSVSSGQCTRTVHTDTPAAPAPSERDPSIPLVSPLSRGVADAVPLGGDRVINPVIGLLEKSVFVFVPGEPARPLTTEETVAHHPAVDEPSINGAAK